MSEIQAQNPREHAPAQKQVQDATEPADHVGREGFCSSSSQAFVLHHNVIVLRPEQYWAAEALCGRRWPWKTTARVCWLHADGGICAHQLLSFSMTRLGFFDRGTVWYRLVGVDLTQGNLTADTEASLRFVTGQMNVALSFGTFVQVVAPSTKVSSGTHLPASNSNMRHDTVVLCCQQNMAQ